MKSFVGTFQSNRTIPYGFHQCGVCGVCINSSIVDEGHTWSQGFTHRNTSFPNHLSPCCVDSLYEIRATGNYLPAQPSAKESKYSTKTVTNVTVLNNFS